MGGRVKLLSFNNVQATGLCNVDLDGLKGFTIERIVLGLGGTTFTKSMLTGIQIKANGKVVFDTTGPRTDSRMQYRGITANANFLTLDFSEIRAKTENGQSIGAIDTTAGISSLKMEIQITGATAPTLVGWAEVSPPQLEAVNQPTRGLISRVHSASQTIGAAGTFALSVPHFSVSDGGSIFKRIAVFSANMNALQIKKNGVITEESTKALNDYQANEYKKVPQAGLYMIDFIIDDNQSQAFNTRDAQTMEILGTFSAGETIIIEVETLEPVGAY